MTTLQWQTKIQGPIAVIGDLHGHTEKLSTVLNLLRKTPHFERRWIVFIGDFVDRGPDTKGTIDLILELMKEHPRTTAIMGNHEFAMCSALGWLPGSEAFSWGDRWISHYNSDPTFESYGAAPGDLVELAKNVPDSHREFLINLPWCVEHPQLLFVHAGLDPNMPYNLQMRILRQRDFTLNRPQWLCEKSFVNVDPPSDCPLTLVSGHVRVDEAVIRPRRILVDTTGGEDGDLSCVLMPEREVFTSSKTGRPSKPASSRQATSGESAKSSWWKFWT